MEVGSVRCVAAGTWICEGARSEHLVEYEENDRRGQ